LFTINKIYIKKITGKPFGIPVFNIYGVPNTLVWLIDIRTFSIATGKGTKSSKTQTYENPIIYVGLVKEKINFVALTDSTAIYLFFKPKKSKIYEHLYPSSIC
jgi:hypothetical protein